MRKTKDYNNLPAAATKDLVLGKGEVKRFKILNIKRDKDHPKRMVIPSIVIVPSRDTIVYKDTPYDIACINSVGEKGSINFNRIWFQKESAGVITLNGDSIRDREMYQYMMLCNYRVDNPDRDKTKRSMFMLIDPVANAQVARASRSTKLKAQSYAAEMENEDILTFAAASGWQTKDVAEDILRDRIEILAENDPVGFLKTASNRNNQIKADVKMAIDDGYIKWNKPEHKFTWASNDELIVKVPRSSKGTHLDGMLNLIINADHGEAVYDEIRSLLGKSIADQKTKPAGKSGNPQSLTSKK